MPLADLFNFVRAHRRSEVEYDKLRDRISEVVKETWHLGLTSFGGPPVHFQIFHKKFVEPQQNREPWLDEQTYQELFAICQAFPGPASTKFLFATVLLRSGWFCAILAFLFWSLPGALCMFGLALGVRQISETLPDPVYALLSGLNASTVGIVAVAAVQLAEKCIKDPLSRILVIFGGCAGLCYSALWYFPVIIMSGGSTAAAWDLWLARRIRMLRQSWEDRQRRATDQAAVLESEAVVSTLPESRTLDNPQQDSISTLQASSQPNSSRNNMNMTKRRQGISEIAIAQQHTQMQSPLSPLPLEVPGATAFEVSLRSGAILLAAFVTSFIVILVARSQLKTEHRPFSLFANMYLAGTIIFGGGPVVIPLLREYVVAPGWVESRDFLIGLAIIQALPGPNFNFSVYLGALALSGLRSRTPSAMAVLGGFLAFMGIFGPGLILTVAFQGFWRKLRTKPLFLALLRGINASAIGLVFTAVYRLWEVGYLSNELKSGAAQKGSVAGRSLADEPWWVVVAVLTFAGNRWFKIAAPVGITVGGLLGISWWGVTQQ